jgi:DNA segregation ATPase FtsK/SpoIIIE, S-DNA-T family
MEGHLIMSSCRFPEHHKSASGLPVLGVVVLAVVVYVVVRLVLVVVRFAEAWWWVPALVLAAAVVVVLAVRPPWLRHLPRAVWAAARWHHLSRNLGLAAPDRHRPGVVRHPRALILPHSHGIMARVRTVPGTGRAEVDKAAEHIANSWRCVRVSVTQPRPGRVVVRGMRYDPLTEPVPASVLPRFDGRHVVLGRDDQAVMRAADLANLSGSAFSGSPGRGKTEAALSLAVQLAPSPLVDTWILDGGACDWAPFAEGAAGYVGDDLDAAVDMLRVLDALMGDRRRNLHSARGVRNGWASGPAGDYRLQWVLVEEAPFYLDLDAVKGDRKREDHVRACRGLLAGLLRRGRAPLFHTTLIAQKGTGTGGLPPDLRDLCGLRWSFGVATTEAAAAILGDDIRQHETMSPTLLQGPEHVGVASVLLRTGTSPYTLVKFPAIGQDRADRAAAVLASRLPAAGDLPDLAGLEVRSLDPAPAPGARP